MELKTTPQNLKTLIEAGMLLKQKPLFDPITLSCSPTLIINKENHGNILALYNTYTPAFFENYTPPSEGESSVIPLPHLLLEKLKSGYHQPTITYKTDKKRWYIDDSIEHNDEAFVDFTEPVFPAKMVSTEHGYLPEKHNPEFSAIIDVSILNLPKMDTYTFEFKSKKFTVSNPKMQNYSKKLETIKTIDSKPIKKVIDAEYLDLVTSQLKGEVYIAFDNNIFILSKVNKNPEDVITHTQTYLIAMMLTE